jgi:hypothetical protein
MSFRCNLSVLLLLATLTGCTTPWDLVKHYPEERHPPKAIVGDVQQYIHAKNIPPDDVGETRYGLDETGRRAVRVLQLPPGSETEFYHALYYDKDLRRTKVRTMRWTHSGEPSLGEVLWYGTH